MEIVWGYFGEGKIKFEQKEKRLYPRSKRSHRDLSNDMMNIVNGINLAVVCSKDSRVKKN